MCLITLNWQPDQAVPLILASNRDEYYARPTLGLHHWPGRGILAGQDLQAGGTWLGLGRCVGNGTVAGPVRMAALTNYRDVTRQATDAESRGHVTTAFLTSSVSAPAYLQALSANTRLYNPFNLILFDGQNLMGFESRHARMFALPVGITSVSNADFNTHWPKLDQLHASFAQALSTINDKAHLKNTLFHLLSDDRVAPDAALPQTGLALDRERALSAAFVRTLDYGTRASSVIRIGHGLAEITERCFDAEGYKSEITALISSISIQSRLAIS